MFRGISKETGKLVYGDLIRKCLVGSFVVPTAIKPLGLVPVEVHPDSIAMKTGINDKNDKPVYGSIEIDGKMSRGGDRVKKYPKVGEYGHDYYKDIVWDIKYAEDAFWLVPPVTKNISWLVVRRRPLEIIGTQWKDK